MDDLTGISNKLSHAYYAHLSASRADKKDEFWGNPFHQKIGSR